MSFCKMYVNGPKSVCSKVGSVLGFAATMKLPNNLYKSAMFVKSSRTYRIRADILSKMYWSKLGLLGFLEMTPRILTRRANMPSNPSNKDERDVIITRITPILSN